MSPVRLMCAVPGRLDIEIENCMTGVDAMLNGVGSDESGASGDQNTVSDVGYVSRFLFC
jgi:hypothetical protein